MKHLLTLGLLFYFSIGVTRAQESAEVLIHAFPTSSVLKIDGQVYHLNDHPSPLKLTLPKGEHAVEIWAPHYVIKKDVIQVDKQITRYNVALRNRSEAYLSYKEVKRKNTLTRVSRYAISAALVAINVAAASYAIDNSEERRLNDLAMEAERIRAEHVTLASTQAFADSRAAFDKVRNEYNDGRDKLHRKRSIGIPLVSATSIVSAGIIFKLLKKKIPKAILAPDTNPFVLNDIRLDAGNGQTTIGLQFKF